MGEGGQRHAPTALPPGKTRYPLYRRLGGPHSRSRRVRKISPPPGFDPRTVKPVASRCTDWAIPAHIQVLTELICNMWFFCHDYNLVAAHPSSPVAHQVETHTTRMPRYHQLVLLKTVHQKSQHSGSILEERRTSLQCGDTLRDLPTQTPRISQTCPPKHHVSPTINNDLLVSRDLP